MKTSVKGSILLFRIEILIDPPDRLFIARRPIVLALVSVERIDEFLSAPGRGNSRLGKFSGSKRTLISLASSPHCHSRKCAVGAVPGGFTETIAVVGTVALVVKCFIGGIVCQPHLESIGSVMFRQRTAHQSPRFHQLEGHEAIEVSERGLPDQLGDSLFAFQPRISLIVQQFFNPFSDRLRLGRGFEQMSLRDRQLCAGSGIEQVYLLKQMTGFVGSRRRPNVKERRSDMSGLLTGCKFSPMLGHADGDQFVEAEANVFDGIYRLLCPRKRDGLLIQSLHVPVCFVDDVVPAVNRSPHHRGRSLSALVGDAAPVAARGLRQPSIKPTVLSAATDPRLFFCTKVTILFRRNTARSS